jgi:outer membrane protein OmpA-like peptidoglycan-associated protein
MKQHLAIISLACLFLQQPVIAQDQVDAVDRHTFNSSLLGLLVGGVLGGPPGAVLGFASGGVIGDLESQNQQLNAIPQELLPDEQANQQRLREQAKQHQVRFQRQQELELNRLTALQQGFRFCLGFRTGSSQIEPKIAAQLDALVEMLKAFPQFQLLIEAGADQRGSKPFNEVLSRKRAEAVAQLLIDAGLSRERISTRYQGESTAVYPLHDVEGLGFDRMVQLTLLHGEAS